MIAIRRRLLDPSFDPIDRNAERPGVRLGHERKQLPLRIRRIESDALKRFKEFLLRKIGIFVLSPFWFAAEQDARERFFGEIIELRPTATLAIFREHGREIGSFLRKDEQLGMTV